MDTWYGVVHTEAVVDIIACVVDSTAQKHWVVDLQIDLQLTSTSRPVTASESALVKQW